MAVFGFANLIVQVILLFAFLATTCIAMARQALGEYLTDISAGKGRGGIVGVWNFSEETAYVVGPILGGLFAQLLGIGRTFALMVALVILTVPVVYAAIRQKKEDYTQPPIIRKRIEGEVKPPLNVCP